MAGHSKWAQIKRKKAVKDASRGKLFGKLIREITVAAKIGGGDPDGNARLRLAIQTAKENNMPQDNIKRAVQKGVGGGEGANFDEVTYEGYGSGGVALMIDTLTDNKNRTASEVRHALTKHGGNLGETGCVSWIFETKGLIWVSKDNAKEEQLFDLAIEAGADDVSDEEEGYEISTSLQDFESVRRAIADAGVEYQSAAIERIPKTLVKIDGDEARKVLRCVEALEDLDDVQHVSANFDVPSEILNE